MSLPRIKIKNLPHVLVIAGGDGEKEWEVEHPVSCPLVCDWSPWLSDYWAGDPQHSDFAFVGGPSLEGDPGHHACYVEYEVVYNGLDSLDIHSPPDDVDFGPYLDPDHVRSSEYEAEWRRLRPGRYLIEGWYHNGVGCGDYGGQGDPDGGLTLLGLA